MKWLKKNRGLLLSILLGAILGLVWNHPFFLPFIFVVFAGVLRLIDAEYKIKKQYFLIILPFILSWHLSVLWWVWNSSIGGFIFMTLLGSIIISISYLTYSIARKINLPILIRYVLWITMTLSLEYFHYNWEGNFPWLNLGNSFSILTSAVQWMSYTGIAGISLWILLTNVLVHHFWAKKLWNKPRIAIVLGLIALPMIGSWIWLKMDTTYRETALVAKHETALQVVILQPNIDAYTTKFVVSPEEQVAKFLSLSIHAQDQLDSSRTTLWVWPETALPSVMAFKRVDRQGRELFVPSHHQMDDIQNYLASHPNVYIITGAVLYGYSPSLNRAVIYNTALELRKNEVLYSHIKSKLVPGGEAMPYQKYLQFLEKFTIQLGGSTLPLERSDIPLLPFEIENGVAKVGAIICYESIFGEYVSQYASHNANVLCLITNDDWWDNTPGHKQHFNYGRMRAIELRRYIARSANTGISAIINPYGEVCSDVLHYREEGTITGNVYTCQEPTLYASYGDYLYRASFYGLLMLLVFSYISLRKRQSKRS